LVRDNANKSNLELKAQKLTRNLGVTIDKSNLELTSEESMKEKMLIRLIKTN